MSVFSSLLFILKQKIPTTVCKCMFCFSVLAVLEGRTYINCTDICLFLPLPAVLDLGSPKGIRFSDVTDTSATVHWVVPRARVDSYKVTYVPAHGGQCPYVSITLIHY